MPEEWVWLEKNGRGCMLSWIVGGRNVFRYARKYSS